MEDLEDAIDKVAATTGVSGVVRVDRDGALQVASRQGLAGTPRPLSPRSIDARFGIASGTKALTVLVVASLVEEGGLDLATTARSVLGEDLPLIDDGVTVEHLLAHPSGIGDYFDEEVVESMTDYVLPGPVHRLVATDDYLAVLDGHHQQFAPGERFAYNNGGFVVLALIAERVSGTPFAELVWARVCEAAGMRDTAFLRSDEPAERVALGYLAGDGLRTNVLHLPVCGSGDGDDDGGIYSTASDVSALWAAMYAGRIVPRERVADLVRPRSDVPLESARCGLGFWLRPAQRTCRVGALRRRRRTRTARIGRGGRR